LAAELSAGRLHFSLALSGSPHAMRAVAAEWVDVVLNEVEPGNLVTAYRLTVLGLVQQMPDTGNPGRRQDPDVGGVEGLPRTLVKGGVAHTSPAVASRNDHSA